MEIREVRSRNISPHRISTTNFVAETVSDHVIAIIHGLRVVSPLACPPPYAHSICESAEYLKGVGGNRDMISAVS